MYLIVMYTIYNDGTKDKPAIYTRDGLDEAVALWHGQMSSAMMASNTQHVLAQVVYVYSGRVERSECWTRPVVHETVEEIAEE